PEGSAGRVQEGILHPVPGHDGPHRRRDHPLAVLHAADRSSRDRAGATSGIVGGRNGRRGSAGAGWSVAVGPDCRARSDQKYSAKEGKGNGCVAVRRRGSLGAEAAKNRASQSRPQRSMPVRQRKEIQKMLRILIFVSCSTLFGAILPDQIGEAKKGPPKT